MRRATIVFAGVVVVDLGLSLIACQTGASDDSSGPPSPPPPPSLDGGDSATETSNADAKTCATLGPACDAYADGMVAAYARCGFDPAPPPAEDAAGWQSGLRRACLARALFPRGAPLTARCGIDLATTSCDALALGQLPDSCVPPGNAGQDSAYAAPCTDEVECPAGRTCETGSPGPYGYPDPKCRAPGGEGAGCGWAHGQFLGSCAYGMSCAGSGSLACTWGSSGRPPTPARAAELGESCRYVRCTLGKALACVEEDGGLTCQARPRAAEGDPCGAGCRGGLVCVGGRCAKPTAVGEPCAASETCAWPARCVPEPPGPARCRLADCP